MQRAAESSAIKLSFQPQGIQTQLTPGQKIPISVLAYTANNDPIYDGVTYQWGISSTNSIGTLTEVSGSIASFIPQNNGIGDIFVTANVAGQEVAGSIRVIVGDVPSEISITPSPTPSCLEPGTPMDTNGDGVITQADLSVFQFNFGKKSESDPSIQKLDLDKDGVISILDISRVAGQIGKTVCTVATPTPSTPVPSPTPTPVKCFQPDDPSDINLDGVINSQDITLVQNAFGKKVETDPSLEKMDFDKDGVISILDISRVAGQNGRTTCPPTPTPSPVYTGFKGEYFANRDLTGDPVLTRDDASINFDWKRGAPATGLPSDRFSARWTKNEYFKAGIYRFKVRSDDGMRVWIDGRRFYNRWYDQGLSSRYFIIRLTEGNHSIKVEYYENRGNASAELTWTGYTR
jgi:hypothetical protein